MKNFHFLWAVAFVFLLSACDQQSSMVDVGPAAGSDELLAKSAAAGEADRFMVLTKKGVSSDFVSSVEALGGTVEFSHEIGFAVISGIDNEQASTLAGHKDVSTIEADVMIQGDPLTDLTPQNASITSPDNPAGAFFFQRQWNMRAVDAEAAWAAGKLGDESVTIAILDTGIDYTHPDLAGLVDLERSISFETDRDDLFAEFFFPDRELVTDLHFHGTHVAATAVSNGLAAAGVSSKNTLMGVKVCTFTDFTCRTSNVLAGILYAVDNGADVLNLSLGGSFPKAGTKGFVSVINRVMNYAKRNKATVVVAAGNAATDLDKNGNAFAAYCDAPHVICVSATGPTAAASINGPFENVDAPAPYTNFGRSAITVAAPGGAAAPVSAACTTTSLINGLQICSTGTFVIGISGTSMATPHVAGLAGTIIADIGKNPAQVKARIMQGADDLGSPGTDKFYGKGRINVATSTGAGI